MSYHILPYSEQYLPGALRVWNQVVEDGEAFPQEELLTPETGHPFFLSQSRTALAVEEGTDRVLGLYILHPNNIGRCGHIGNASYAVLREARGRRIGEALVKDSLAHGRACGFSLIQFNAVVAGNLRARNLYRHLGFRELGAIPKGFRRKDGVLEDIWLYYYVL